MNLLRSAGFSGKGFAIGVKKRIFQTFIQPRLEYGLQLMQPKSAPAKMVQKTQNCILRAMLGVGKTTSVAAMQALVNIESVQQRCYTLNASWAARTEGLSSKYMVAVGREAYRCRPLRYSIFRIEGCNPHMTQYRDATIWSGNPRPSTRDRRDILEAISQREKDKDISHDLICPDTAAQIDRIGSARARRTLMLWILRRLLGEPRPCHKCPAQRADYDHVQECTGMDVDANIKAGNWSGAATQLMVILETCLGRPTGRLRSELEQWQEQEQ